MTTALLSDNCLVDRRYTGIIGSGWHVRPRVVEIFQQQDFLNIFSNQMQLSAWALFREQLQKNAERIYRFNQEDLVISFSKMLNTLLKINASGIYTQITSVNSLVLKAETAKGNLYAEMFFDEFTGWLSETVVNIIHHQKLEFNNSGSLDVMVLEIKQYFGIEETDYFTILNQPIAYDLSGTALTTIDF